MWNAFADIHLNSGYVCFQNRGDNIYGCTSLVTSESVLTVLSVSYETITGDSTTSYPIETSTITTTIEQDEYEINAFGIIVQRLVATDVSQVDELSVADTFPQTIG
jgi:hypothetical protein